MVVYDVVIVLGQGTVDLRMFVSVQCQLVGVTGFLPGDCLILIHCTLDVYETHGVSWDLPILSPGVCSFNHSCHMSCWYSITVLDVGLSPVVAIHNLNVTLCGYLVGSGITTVLGKPMDRLSILLGSPHL